MGRAVLALVIAVLTSGCVDDDPQPGAADPCASMDGLLGACGLVWTEPGGICAIENGRCYAACMVGSTCEEMERGNWSMDALLCFGGCEPTQECMDGSGSIRESWVCDFEEDCLDGSDEVACVHYSCPDGTPVPDADLCDGTSDCADGSDEWTPC
jgi:hypothetical protein